MKPPTAPSTPQSVAASSPEDKLLRAAQLALHKLPVGMRAEFAALFEPKALAATTALLGAWAAAHATPRGWAVDVGMLLLGLVSMGALVFVALEHLERYVRLALAARDERGLDAAANELARAIAIVGVQTLVALITRRAATRVASATSAARAARYERLLAQMPGAARAPLGRRGFTTALDFMTRKFPKWSDAELSAKLRGIDFSKPVEVRTFSPHSNVRLAGYRDVLVEAHWNAAQREMSFVPRPQAPMKSSFFTDAGVPVDRLGVASGQRYFVRFRVTRPVEVLESTAAAIADTWTAGRTPSFRVSAKPGELGREIVAGGGKQYLIANPAQFLEVVPPAP